MLEPTDELRALDRRWEEKRYRDMTFREALALYTALWAESRALCPDASRDWKADLEPDLAMARALNGLPPS